MPTQFKVLIRDITTFRADAIVNAANESLLGGGGVDGAIHRAAGPMLYVYCKRLGGCKTGEAKRTPACDISTAKYIIHTPGPVFTKSKAEKCDELLKNSYRNSLALAEEVDCRSIAFPSISTGIYRFPVERAAKLVAEVFDEYRKAEGKIQRVTMCCFDPVAEEAYRNAFNELGLLQTTQSDADQTPET